MSEFKGTKGKWYIGKGELLSDRNEHMLISPIESVKTNEGYRNVCSISILSDADKEDWANAQLISKAPEMLECLQWLLKSPNLSKYDIEKVSKLIKEATEL